MSCGADTEANALMASLLAGEDLDIPDVDLDDPAFNPPSVVGNEAYNQITHLTNEDLTTRNVGGSGTFDAIMESQANHLRSEYDAGRITGAEYTKAYVALTQSAMSQGVQYLLGKDQAYWAAVNAQMQAITARVQLQVAKTQLAIAIIEAKNQRATYALTKVRLANEDMQYCVNKFNLEQMLPEQKKLVSEQVETARAQTMETRTDGTAVLGTVGKQKELYSQQITSYQRSSELNASRVFSDAWLAHKAIDEGIETPAMFSSATISSVLSTLKTNNNL